MKKEIIRRKLGIKKGGRATILVHGAGKYSVQVVRNGRTAEHVFFKMRGAEIIPA